MWEKYADGCDAKDAPDYCKTSFNRDSWFEDSDEGLSNRDIELKLLGKYSMSEDHDPAVSNAFDWTAATIGASAGFIVGYALVKALLRKSDDDFDRA